MTSRPHVTVMAVTGLPEISAGDDLAALVADLTSAPLLDGDIVVVTSKVVSKAAGLSSVADRTDLLPAHTDRVVARRGATAIVRTKQGLTLAAAGLDASNTPVGTVLALPADPDAEAAALRSDLHRLTGANVAVVISDTAGRPWRLGQTDIAVGVAGLTPLADLSGTSDPYGNVLAVTAPAVADAVAAAADLVQGKLARVPVAVVRGLAAMVLARGDHGPGAASLVRPEETDLFGWGAADAVRAAVRRDDPDRHRGFPRSDDPLADLIEDALAAADTDEVRLVPALDAGGNEAAWDVVPVGAANDEALWQAGALVERLHALATATRRGLRVERGGPGTRLARVTVHDLPARDQPTT